MKSELIELEKYVFKISQKIALIFKGWKVRELNFRCIKCSTVPRRNQKEKRQND